MYQRFGKRGFDIVASAVLAIALLPALAAIALAIRLRLGAPILFRQTRPGRSGAPFEILKFRTMRDACDATGCPLPDAERLDSFGALIRALSLDELPELWNVLRGDMSLVGPRPLLTAYLPRYSAHHMRRHDVRPGITGLAQVSGRNALEWEQRFRLDLDYVARCSFRLDLALLGRTLSTTLRRDGISQPGHVTAAAFKGTAANE